jgi:hypothetical protein
MDVAEMARRAGVSRDTAHRILKGTFEQNQFRMFVNMLLLKALGSKPEGLPQSVEAILRLAEEDVKTIGGHPNFRAAYNEKEVLCLAWPA